MGFQTKGLTNTPQQYGLLKRENTKVKKKIGVSKKRPLIK
jgi:hypothetical protein